MIQISNLKSRTPNPEPRVAGVRFQPTGKIYHFAASDHHDLQPGDFVLVETIRGQQLGEVVSVRLCARARIKKTSNRYGDGPPATIWRYGSVGSGRKKKR